MNYCSLKLEDIAKRAPFDIRSEHFTPEFFLECLATLKQKKYKLFKKITIEARSSKKMFDGLLEQQQMIIISEAQERLNRNSRKSGRALLTKKQTIQYLAQKTTSGPIKQSSGRSDDIEGHIRAISSLPLMEDPPMD